MISFVEKLKFEPFIKQFSGRKAWNLSPLRGGLLNENYLLTFGTKKFVLKIYRPEMTEAKIREMFRLMKFAADRSIPVVCSLKEKIIDGHTVAIYPFVNGTHPARYRNTHARMRSMGAMLGKIHSVLDTYKPIKEMPSHEKLIKSLEPRASLEEISSLREQFNNYPQNIRHEFMDVLDTFENIITTQTWDITAFSKIPIRYIHGDYHIMNLLMEDTRIVTVLDWEKSGWNFRGYEIMRSIIFNCRKTASEFSWPLIEEYLKAYREHATVSKIEAELAFECGYRPVVFGFWAIKQYLAGHKHFRTNIVRRKEIVQLLTKHRAEYGAKIAELLKL